MRKLIVLLLAVSFNLLAADLKITNFYRMDRQNLSDPAHDVCFRVSPAPAAGEHLHATVTADKGYRTQGHYHAIVGSEGSVCTVISSFRGVVEVKIPSLDLEIKKSL